MKHWEAQFEDYGAVVPDWPSPIWIDIMRPWVERRRAALGTGAAFLRPDNVVIVDLPGGPEVFIAGTEPVIR